MNTIALDQYEINNSLLKEYNNWFKIYHLYISMTNGLFDKNLYEARNILEWVMIEKENFNKEKVISEMKRLFNEKKITPGMDIDDYVNELYGLLKQTISVLPRYTIYNNGYIVIGDLQKKHILLSLLIAAFLGFFVVLVELPCTGAPYLAVLALIGQGNIGEGLPLLLLYNFIFILPLFFIIGIGYFSKSSDKLKKWREENKTVMRLATGIFLIALGVYMLYSITG